MKCIVILSACISSLPLYAANPHTITNILAQKAAFTTAMNNGDRTAAAQALGGPACLAKPTIPAYDNLDRKALYAPDNMAKNFLDAAKQMVEGTGLGLPGNPFNTQNPFDPVSAPQRVRLACITGALLFREIQQHQAQTRIDNNYDCTGISTNPHTPDTLPTHSETRHWNPSLKPVTPYEQATTGQQKAMDAVWKAHHGGELDTPRMYHALHGISGHNNSAAVTVPTTASPKPSSPITSRTLGGSNCCYTWRIYGPRVHGPCDCCLECLVACCWECDKCCSDTTTSSQDIVPVPDPIP